MSLRNKSTREVGNILEDYVVELIRKVDKDARRTKNSGASNEISDIYNKYFYVECKNSPSKTDLPVKREVWYKLIGKMPNGDKVPLYIIANKHNDRFIVMDLDEFFREFVYKLYEHEGE
jgi:hypothetical protein